MKYFWRSLLFMAIALPLTAAALDQTWKLFTISDWSGGVNIHSAPQKIKENQAQAISNLMIDEKPGTITTRRGFTLVITTPTLSKINLEFAFNKDDGSSEFIVSDSSVVLTTTDLLHFTKIRSGLTATAHLRAIQARNKVWFTNGSDSVFTWDGSTCMVLDGQTYSSTVTPNVPLGKYPVYYHSRIWLYNVPGNNSALRYSALSSTDGIAIALDDARAWPASQQLNVSQGDGQVGTGLVVYNSRLYAFKSRSKYAVFGSDEFSYFIRPTDADTGTSAHESIVPLDGLHYYIDENGVYQADDANSKRISDDIYEDIENVQNNQTNIVGYTWDTKAQFDRGSQVSQTTTTADGLLKVYTQPQFLNYGPDGSTTPANSFIKPLNSVSTSTHWMVLNPTNTIDNFFPGTLDSDPFSGSQSVAFVYYARCIGGTDTGNNLFHWTMANDASGGTEFQSGGGGVAGPITNGCADPRWKSGNVYWTSSSSFTGRDITNGKVKIRIELESHDSAQYEVYVPTAPGNAQIFAFPISTGQYISEVSTFTPLTFWDTFQAINNTGGGTVNYFIRGATSAVNISTETWMPISPGSVIPLPVAKSFVQWASTMSSVLFSTTNIDNVTINRNQGGSSDSQPFAISWKNRYWLAVSTQSSGTTEIIYVKSRGSQTQSWMRFDGINIKSFAIYNDSLYGGSGTDGSIYRLDYGTNDNGTAISWSWKTADLFFEQPFFEKDFKEILIEAKKDNQTMYVDYCVDSGTTTTLPITLTGSSGRLLKSLYAINRKGKYANFTFRGATLDKPIEFHTFGILYDLQQTR